MTVEMHPVLLESWFCADVQREVNAGGATINITSAMLDPGLVLWSRLVPPTLTNNDGMVRISFFVVRCLKSTGRRLDSRLEQMHLYVSGPLTLNITNGDPMFMFSVYYKKEYRRRLKSKPRNYEIIVCQNVIKKL